jgi:hypothetical protein
LGLLHLQLLLKIDIDILSILSSVKESLYLTKLYQKDNPINICSTEFEEKFKILNENLSLENISNVNSQGIIRGVWYIQLCLEQLKKKINCTPNSNNLSFNYSSSSIPIIMCFLPNVVTISALLGIPLVLRSVHLPSPSVLERINSLLEDPRSLVLGEDTQKIFNNL